jgi:hypothetical protein
VTSDTQDTATTSGPEHKKLGVFLGRWHTTGEVAGSAPGPGVDSIDTYEWYPGGFFLIHHADAKVGGDDIQSIEIMGYDPARPWLPPGQCERGIDLFLEAKLSASNFWLRLSCLARPHSSGRRSKCRATPRAQLSCYLASRLLTA